jgi:hypothetical protein
LLNLFLRPWRWRRYVPPKRRLTLNGLHNVISQKLLLFITTAVKTSNPQDTFKFSARMGVNFGSSRDMPIFLYFKSYINNKLTKIYINLPCVHL